MGKLLALNCLGRGTKQCKTGATILVLVYVCITLNALLYMSSIYVYVRFLAPIPGRLWCFLKEVFIYSFVIWILKSVLIHYYYVVLKTITNIITLFYFLSSSKVVPSISVSTEIVPG